jgi:AraC-like DNA-binding protein
MNVDCPTRLQLATPFSLSTASRRSARDPSGRPSARGPHALRRGARPAQAIRLRQYRDAAMKSRFGRPRKVTDAQIATILAWHDAVLAWRAQRRTLKTLSQLAQELGLSRATISRVIKQRGNFKQASPEEMETERQFRRERLSQVHERSRGGVRSKRKA